MYDVLLQRIEKEYVTEKTLKTGPRGQILLLRSKTSHKRVVFRRFKGSAEVYQKLLDVDCPHLPQVYAAAEKDGEALVLEEYIQGDNLAMLLDSGPLTTEQTRQIAIHVCLALTVLHGFHAVHRDIKPENILLRGDEAVVIDFDASRLFKPMDSMDSDTHIMGTTGYAAPEQFGLSQTDARADLYALGVLINEMLVCCHPSRALADGPLRPVIEKCIEVNIDKRFSSAEAVITALNAHSRQRRQLLWLLLPAAMILLGIAAMLLLPEKLNTSAPSAQSLPLETEPPVPITQDYPLPETYTGQRQLDILITSWLGAPSSDYTPFRYDLNGDGVEEDYVFSVGTDIHGGGVNMTATDGRSPTPERPSLLTIAPVVGKKTDSGYVFVPEFAELLSGRVLRFYCAESAGTGQPELYSTAPLLGTWPGSVSILFGAEDTGTWIYEYIAELDGQTLTSRGLTTVFSDGPNEEKDPAPAENAIEAYKLLREEAPLWTGGELPPSTVEFHYDLDGDGQTEKYLFGVGLAQPLNPPQPKTQEDMVVDGILQPLPCQFAPCVWKETESGYVPVPEFAALLDPPKLNLYCLEAWGTESPELWAASPFDREWTAVVAYFTENCAGRWLAEVSTALDGQPMTACLQLTASQITQAPSSTNRDG